MPETGLHFTDARGPDGIVLYAMGDIHGRLDLLTALHDSIAQDITRRGARDWRIIHLGDYVDRGPDAKGVLDFLIRSIDRDPRNIALIGNHDIGLLEFLAEPSPESLFARYGGVQTAQSYGVELSVGNPITFKNAAMVLRRAVPQAHVRFLKSLDYSTSFGDFFFCHAGIRPGVILADQKPQDLIWIREHFLLHQEPHLQIVVHGHTICKEPEIMGNRVNVDTGAYASGRLTALVVDGLEKQILDVQG